MTRQRSPASAKKKGRGSAAADPSVRQRTAEAAGEADGGDRLTALVPVLVALFIWLMPVAADDDRREFNQPLASIGYNEVVEQIFVPLRWLVRNDPDAEGAPDQPIVTLASRARAFPEVNRFVSTSFLGDDLRANDQTRWRFAGNRVIGVNPWLHSTVGPRADRRGWRGDIHYGNERRTEVAIEAAGRRLNLFAPAEHRPIDWDVSINGETEAGEEGGRGLHFTDGDWIAAVERIGRNVIVRSRLRHPRYRAVVLDPGGMTYGHASADEITYRLRPASRLVFLRHGESRRSGPVYRLAGGAVPASQYRPFGARLYDPIAEGLTRPLSQILAGASRRNPTLVERDVNLTLDANLHSDAQQRLEAESTRLLRAVRHPFRAAITVMDAHSGDLLALASYPTAALSAQSGLRVPDSWAAQNQNFVALPIGSVAKVPFAAAILTRHPQLATLVIASAERVPGGGFPFRSVIGVEFGRPINDTVGLPSVDFGTFLEQSSNRYAAALVMLAAARGDPRAEDGHALSREDQYSLAGRQRSRAPLLAFPCQQRLGTRCRGFGGNDRFTSFLGYGTTWPDLLARLFDLPGAISAPGAPVDTRIWDPLIGRWPPAARRSFASLSPERESFSLGAIENIRNDYLALIIGGGRSRWTNVKVAEAMARIVLDNRVSARVVRPEQPDPRENLRSGIGARAIAEIRSGMRRAHQAGTASQIVPGFSAPRGYDLRIFAKTGTPSIASAARSPLNGEIQALIELRIIDMVAGDLGIPGRRADETALQAMARLRSGRPVSRGVTNERLLRMMDLLSRDRRDGGSRLQFDANGRLAGVGPDIADPLSERGGAVAFVIGLYPSGRSEADTPPLRALTIAINVQARVRIGAILGDNPAVLLARDLLAREGAIARWLIADIPAPAPAAAGAP